VPRKGAKIIAVLLQRCAKQPNGTRGVPKQMDIRTVPSRKRTWEQCGNYLVELCFCECFCKVAGVMRNVNRFHLRLKLYRGYRHEEAYVGNLIFPENPIPDVIDMPYSGNELDPTQKSIAALKPLIQASVRRYGSRSLLRFGVDASSRKDPPSSVSGGSNLTPNTMQPPSGGCMVCACFVNLIRRRRYRHQGQFRRSAMHLTLNDA
jgi:hypothetical protein